MKKLISITLILILLGNPVSYAGILDKKVTLIKPGNTKATVLVGIFSDKVTHIWGPAGWVELSGTTQKYYQRLYRLQYEKKTDKTGSGRKK